jgi:hypothetical protein
MKQIDLNDLPPRAAQLLKTLAPGELLTLVQGGLVVGRLAGAEAAPPPADETPDERTPEERMTEVMEQFKASIHDEF